MHSSGAASNKPRQRTFTSCTECRRRKQRCNQAKDRPCNNCIRRFPPVECFYEGTTPPAVSEHAHNHYVNQSHPMGDHSHSHVASPGYTQPPNTPYGQTFVSNTGTDGYFPNTYSSFSTPTLRPYYSSTSSDSTSAGSLEPNYVATTSAGGDDYLMEDDGAYYGGTEPDYGGVFYAQVNQVNQSRWTTGQSDVPTFTGTSSTGDYYYGHVGDQHNVRTTRA